MFDEPYDLKELANRTGLSYATLWWLQANQFTLAVRYGTIQALGYAAGLRLVSTEFSYTVALVR